MRSRESGGSSTVSCTRPSSPTPPRHPDANGVTQPSPRSDREAVATLGALAKKLGTPKRVPQTVALTLHHRSSRPTAFRAGNRFTALACFFSTACPLIPSLPGWLCLRPGQSISSRRRCGRALLAARFHSLSNHRPICERLWHTLHRDAPPWRRKGSSECKGALRRLSGRTHLSFP